MWFKKKKKKNKTVLHDPVSSLFPKNQDVVRNTPLDLFNLLRYLVSHRCTYNPRSILLTVHLQSQPTIDRVNNVLDAPLNCRPIFNVNTKHPLTEIKLISPTVRSSSRYYRDFGETSISSDKEMVSVELRLTRNKGERCTQSISKTT